MIQIYLLILCLIYFVGYLLGVTYFPEILEKTFNSSIPLDFNLIYVIFLVNLTLFLFSKLIPKTITNYSEETLFGLNSVYVLLNIFLILINLYLWMLNGFAFSLYGYSINGAGLFNLLVVTYPLLNLIQAFNWRNLNVTAKIVFVIFLFSQLIIIVLLGKRLEFLVLFAGPLAIIYSILSLRMKISSIFATLCLFSIYSISRVSGNFSIVQLLTAAINEFYLASIGLGKVQLLSTDSIAAYNYPQFWYGFMAILPDFISGKKLLYDHISSVRNVFSPYGASSILVELKLGSRGGNLNLAVYYILFCSTIGVVNMILIRLLGKIGIPAKISILFSCLIILLNARNGLIISIKNGTQAIIFLYLIITISFYISQSKRFNNNVKN
jgi:hypothetical protein